MLQVSDLLFNQVAGILQIMSGHSQECLFVLYTVSPTIAGIHSVGPFQTWTPPPDKQGRRWGISGQEITETGCGDRRLPCGGTTVNKHLGQWDVSRPATSKAGKSQDAALLYSKMLNLPFFFFLFSF